MADEYGNTIEELENQAEALQGRIAQAKAKANQKKFDEIAAELADVRARSRELGPQETKKQTARLMAELNKLGGV